MAFGRAASASAEHREAALQPPGQLGRGHRGHPRRRQLGRQRDPIQLPHDRRDRRRVLGGHLKTGPDRALGEQTHRLRLGDRVQAGAGARHPQRRHRHQVFPLDPQALAAGGQDHEPFARLLQDAGQRCGLIEQVLTVIEHQQQLLSAQELHQRLAGALPGSGGHREHRRDRIVRQGGVADRCQLSKPRPIRKPFRCLGGCLHCQPGLAHPARPGQGHHPRCGQRCRDVLQLALSADERAHLYRQIAGALRDRDERRRYCLPLPGR
jgi:hypothetical protein